MFALNANRPQSVTSLPGEIDLSNYVRSDYGVFARTTRTVIRKVVLFGLAAAVFVFIYRVFLTGLPEDHLLRRYLDGHPIERWTVALFLAGCAVLADRLARVGREHRDLARTRQFLRDLDLRRLAQRENAHEWLAEQLGDLAGSLAGKRLAAIADPAGGLRAADQYGAVVRDLAEFDLDSLERGTTVLRFVTWAIPILGFLGTVLGITAAIAHVTPEQLENSLGEVTAGLSVAFDTTALALALSIGLMAGSAFVDRLERQTFAEIDRFARFDLQQRLLMLTPQADEARALRQLVEAAVAPIRETWATEREQWYAAVQELASRQVSLLQEATSRMLEQLRAHALSQHDAWTACAEQAVRALNTAALEAATRIGDAGRQGATRLSSELKAALETFKNLAVVQEQTLLDSAERLNQTLQRVESHGLAMLKLAETLNETLQKTEYLTSVQQTLEKNLETLVQTSGFQETVGLLAATVQLVNSRLAQLVQNTKEPPRTRSREAA